ncbi:hypothetical protein PLICRDRAFT_366459 [Plicaturopsis crispa FD-325 SS-3]|uniref:Uncharacterized protein n=1 Tax=Plicaturopsis crispa FD-325 SS-3 TaxID=944288 RepID=A0A0C9T789_PLICR|nr:hypothetical protein PLICRDRAFT_366459 [Plicaturopsis crispa FD-325 SS-3]
MMAGGGRCQNWGWLSSTASVTHGSYFDMDHFFHIVAGSASFTHLKSNANAHFACYRYNMDSHVFEQSEPALNVEQTLRPAGFDVLTTACILEEQVAKLEQRCQSAQEECDAARARAEALEEVLKGLLAQELYQKKIGAAAAAWERAGQHEADDSLQQDSEADQSAPSVYSADRTGSLNDVSAVFPSIPSIPSVDFDTSFDRSWRVPQFSIKPDRAFTRNFTFSGLPTAGPSQIGTFNSFFSDTPALSTPTPVPSTIVPVSIPQPPQKVSSRRSMRLGQKRWAKSALSLGENVSILNAPPQQMSRGSWKQSLVQRSLAKASHKRFSKKGSKV